MLRRERGKVAQSSQIRSNPEHCSIWMDNNFFFFTQTIGIKYYCCWDDVHCSSRLDYCLHNWFHGIIQISLDILRLLYKPVVFFFFSFWNNFLFKNSCMAKTMVKYTSVMVTWKGHLGQYELYLYIYQFIKIQTWASLGSRVKPGTDLDFNFSVHIICFIVICSLS